METHNDSIDAQAAIDRIREQKSNKADALAYLAGALQYHVDQDEDVSPETIKDVFNDACDENSVESLEIE